MRGNGSECHTPALVQRQAGHVLYVLLFYLKVTVATALTEVVEVNIRTDIGVKVNPMDQCSKQTLIPEHQRQRM